ncbi:MAG: hypothetical protein Q4D94_09900 [Bacillota bacterium]|nr:hypothetical protein [Bacillota bacterium]
MINLNDYKDLYERCSIQKEKALSSYVVSMIKLLFGLKQIKNTHFHIYERKMLENVMQIFANQFKEQVESALECNDTYRKKSIIDDIEDALSQIIHVYKNVIDSSSSADRRMFLSLTVNTNLYEISPKLCAFYTTILERLVNIFDEDNNRYAFVIHPTLECNTRTKLLFKERKTQGRVVVIYIPVQIMEQIDIVPIYLLHEAFHVIAREARQRKSRCAAFFRGMLTTVCNKILEGIIFFENDRESDRKLKDKLIQEWFDGIRTKFNEEFERDEEAALFYGDQTVKYTVSLLTKAIQELEGKVRNSLMEKFIIVNGEEKILDFSPYYTVDERIKKWVYMIKKNIYNILFNNLLVTWANFFMHLYRETYADIACILSMDLPAEKYSMAFEDSVPFLAHKFTDLNCEIRKLLVAGALCNDGRKDYQNLWTIEKNNILSQMQGIKAKKKICGGQEKEICDMIPYDERTFKYYDAYLCKVIENLKDLLKDKASIEGFRLLMKRLLEKDEDMIKDILIGQFGQ